MIKIELTLQQAQQLAQLVEIAMKKPPAAVRAWRMREAMLGFISVRF